MQYLIGKIFVENISKDKLFNYSVMAGNQLEKLKPKSNLSN